MPEQQDNIVLVVPVWNDFDRFSRFAPFLAEALSASCLPVRWVISDDGSSPEEQEKLRCLMEELRAIYPRVECLFSSKRSRKGGAIYRAWNAYPEAEWVGFVDADGAINPSTVLQLIRTAVEEGNGMGRIGVRRNCSKTPVKRPFGRTLSFHIFSFLVRRLIGLRFVDTQCGIKILPGPAYRAIAHKLEEFGFIFDLELLLALDQAGYSIVEAEIPCRDVAVRIPSAWRMLIGFAHSQAPESGSVLTRIMQLDERGARQLRIEGAYKHT